MTTSVGALARVGGLCLAAVLVQISGVAQVRVAGAAPDLIPLLVAAVALFAGTVSGALCGFTAGLVLDLALGQELGASSLVLTVVGYAVGRYREVRDPAHGLIPLPVAAAATAAYAVGTALVSSML